MPASGSFMSTCATAIVALPEYAAFQAALAQLSASGEGDKLSAWNAAYSDGQIGGSPAYRLRRAIRSVIANAEVSQAVTLSQPDREAAYQTLVTQVVPDASPPVVSTERTPALTAEDIDMLRSALIQMTTP